LRRLASPLPVYSTSQAPYLISPIMRPRGALCASGAHQHRTGRNGPTVPCVQVSVGAARIEPGRPFGSPPCSIETMENDQEIRLNPGVARPRQSGVAVLDAF